MNYEKIIDTIEKAILNEQWSIDYHTDRLAASVEKKTELELELATLKVAIGKPTPGFEDNAPLHEEKELQFIPGNHF